MDYQKQAADLMAKYNLEFRAVLIGDDCPAFCADAEANRDMDKVNVYPRKTHIHGKHYRCTFSRKDHGHVTIDFWNSYADEEYNARGSRAYQLGESMIQYDRKGRRKPTPYDVLACITKSDPGTFEDFCSEYGYDADSRKAEGVYHAVQREWSKVQHFFSVDEITELQEVA